tara:strand:+ start:679 stop:1833 length:1155 start_codon:yes stop_codon:yes gene_type:complete
MTKQIKLTIDKPNDSRETFEPVMVSSENLGELLTNNYVHNVSYDRRAKDPIHSGLVKFWRNLFPSKRNYRRKLELHFEYEKPFLLYIEELPIALQRKRNRYFLNGKAESLSTICNALARVTFKAIRVKDSVSLMKTLMNTLLLPEDIKYCIENRAPFHFYESFTRVDVRLNVMQISETMMAIEVSDGVWGEISVRELTSFCTFFLHGKQMGKFQFMGVKRLYEKVMGSKPTEGQFIVMKAFLKQNRQQDIVEERALQLLSELNEQYDRLLLINNEDGSPNRLYVKGKDYDWMLTDNEFKNDIQQVSTYVLQPIRQEDANLVWKGPICIDNMASGSSLGDQFAGRAMALLNDTMTIKIVNTITRYLTTPPNTHRMNFNEMQRVQL